MRQILSTLYPIAVVIARKPHIPNFYISTQNNNENKITWNSGVLWESKRDDKTGSSFCHKFPDIAIARKTQNSLNHRLPL